MLLTDNQGRLLRIWRLHLALYVLCEVKEPALDHCPWPHLLKAVDRCLIAVQDHLLRLSKRTVQAYLLSNSPVGVLRLVELQLEEFRKQITFAHKLSSSTQCMHHGHVRLRLRPRVIEQELLPLGCLQDFLTSKNTLLYQNYSILFK